MLRSDREDLTAQHARVARAREEFADALTRLADHARRAGLGDVAEECRALVRVLGSRAKRPPAVDTAAWLGALSAARRHRDDYPWEYDAAEAHARDAERLLDTAVYDLHTARGEDG